MTSSDAWDRASETLDVLADPDARRALEDTEDVLVGHDKIRALLAERSAREAR